MNHVHDKLLPWRIAAARRTFVLWATLPLIWSEAYMKTWYEVFRSEDGG